jgi:uncharacterized protein (TIGR03435 family)
MSSAPLPEDERYDVTASLPRRNERAAKKLVAQSLAAAFDLTIRRERRRMEIFVLSPVAGKSPTLEMANDGVHYDPETGHYAPNADALDRMKAGETFFFSMGTTADLANHLGHYLDCPVIDDTGDTECCYLFFFPYDTAHPDREALIRIVEAKYALNLSPETREIEVLVVEPASAVDQVSVEPRAE